MFRLPGWRLGLALSHILLQKNTNSTGDVPSSVRHVGTVLSFMHRRGYGFLREDPPTDESAAATAAASSGGRTYFFPRSSLDGGFYLSDGQCVAFDVKSVTSSRRLNSKLSNSDPLARAAVDDDDAATSSQGSQEAGGATLSIAHRIRLYNAGKEQPVRPPMLCGVVENWDSPAGTGVVAELDIGGNLHDGAPRFTLALEDMDLGGREEMRRGRYVRFCLEAGDKTAARRVIIDRTAERRRAAIGRSKEDEVLSKAVRHYGTVREIVEGRFGFLVLDESGESVFFHMSNAEEGVKQGDTVSFVLREVSMGKHSGKKTCLQVRKSAGRSAPAHQTAKSKKHFDDDDEFDLMD